MAATRPNSGCRRRRDRHLRWARQASAGRRRQRQGRRRLRRQAISRRDPCRTRSGARVRSAAGRRRRSRRRVRARVVGAIAGVRCVRAAVACRGTARAGRACGRCGAARHGGGTGGARRRRCPRGGASRRSRAGDGEGCGARAGGHGRIARACPAESAGHRNVLGARRACHRDGTRRCAGGVGRGDARWPGSAAVDAGGHAHRRGRPEVRDAMGRVRRRDGVRRAPSDVGNLERCAARGGPRRGNRGRA